MFVLFLRGERQMARISPFFPLSHGVPRVDDRRVISGIIYGIKHGLQWKDAPKASGPHKIFKTLVRWSIATRYDRCAHLLLGNRHRGCCSVLPQGNES
jgi:transposase